jgi:3-deoxy-7-phosphoheptulonate synthase
MLIVMKPDATEAQVEEVLDVIRSLGFKPHPMPGATRTAIGITGNPGAIDPAHFEMLSGVAEAIRVSKPYKLVGRDLKHDDTIVRVGNVEIGGPEPAIIAGPCAVESYEQTMTIAELVAACGVKLFRGGAFKPRTSPYSFQGLGEEGLKILAAARDRSAEHRDRGADTETADLVEEYADICKSGAQHAELLTAAKSWTGG